MKDLAHDFQIDLTTEEFEDKKYWVIRLIDSNEEWVVYETWVSETNVYSKEEAFEAGKAIVQQWLLHIANSIEQVPDLQDEVTALNITLDNQQRKMESLADKMIVLKELFEEYKGEDDAEGDEILEQIELIYSRIVFG
jgi:hypothetical protein